MGKSSSHKKKRSRKNSSQGRTKKKTKSRSRRYNKSKKIRYHDDSLSHSSDDDSRSFMSVSCSGPEDDYRSRRARSHTRKDLKGCKKKDRRRSFSRERSEESRRVRKKIGSKRKGGSDLGTKTHKKKRKPSREVSVSSMSSDSCSCDARQVGSTSSHEREFERHSHRGRYDGQERKKGKSEKVRSGSKRSRYRSRSCSSCSRSSEGDEYWTEVKKAGENNMKRLRSVITVIEEEGRFSDNDEHKEEIVYDNDDYPSCRSNDSNDGGHKRELDHRSNVASDNNMMVVNEKKGEEPVVSNIRTTDLTESFKDVEGQRSRTNPSSCMVGTNDFVKGKVTEVSGSMNGEDLESTLRQRALENLKRFRGGFQPNTNTRTGKKDNSYGDVKQSSTVKSEIVQIKLPKEDGVKTVGGAKSWKGDGSKSVGATQELKEIRVPAVRSNSNSYSQKKENTSSGTEVDHQSVTANQEIACVPDPMAVAGQPSEKLNSAVVSEINIPKLATPALRHNSFKNHNTLKERSASDEPRQTNLLVTKSASVECAPETAQTMTPTSNNNNNEAVKNACGPAAPECSSCIKSTLAVDGSNKSQDETTDGSQFEQKTMTVMRGGEMVQVSYKVYIPKKAPAFTRRQLKR